MENTKKLGQEPAFPSKGSANCTTLSGYTSYQNLKFEGMSKRFYAACAAMQGLLANHQLMITISNWYPNESQVMEIRKHYTIMAYEYADELLKQENE